MSQQPTPNSRKEVNINDSTLEDNNIVISEGDAYLIDDGGVLNLTVQSSAGLAEVIAKILIEKLSSVFSPATQKEYRYRKLLLDKVKEDWLEGVLEESLHAKALIDLGLGKRLDAVERPFSDVQDLPDKSVQTLSTGTNISDIFQIGEGRTLLILGEPGSGKTITLLKLAQSLIACAEKDESLPIPVVFNLSSWASKQQNITEWLVEELHSKYGIPKKLGKAWLSKEQLLLLLDGLDEVKADRREDCVQALNQFLQEHGLTQMVVCSRIRDYEALSTRLKLRGAIYIQSLTSEQINQYLETAGEHLETLKTLLQEDTVLQELAKSPLTLSIMTLAYQGIGIEDLPKKGSVEDHRKHLFDAYIERMFKRKGAEQQYSRALTIRWLTWLAQRMFQETKTVFLIEQIQPNLLSKRLQVWIYATAWALIVCSISCAILLGSIYALKSQLIHGLIIDSSIGLVAALAGGIGEVVNSKDLTIKPVERIKWSWNTANKVFLPSVRVHTKLLPIFGINIFLLIILAIGTSSIITALYTAGLQVIVLLALGLVIYVIGGLTAPSIEIKMVPNQGIWNSMKNGIGIAFSGILISLIVAFAINAVIRVEVSLFWTTFCGLFFLFIAMAYELGLTASIKHFILRILLTWNGWVPWNYARFLDYATERIFLQKVGGGYIFIHRLLLEHFAQMELEQVRR